MYEDKKLPSKMRTFRFNDAMEGDLAFLMELWSCTATEALTRALSNSAVLERAFAIQCPASGIPVTLSSAASNNADHPTPTAQIEKPAPSTPIIKESTASVPASVTGESAASVPTKTKGGNKVRYQFKIFLKDEPDSKPGTPSGETAEIAIANAKKWLREHDREDFEPYFPAGTHCKTFKI